MDRANETTAILIQKRIEYLHELADLMHRWLKAPYGDDSNALRRQINQRLPVARRAVRDAGLDRRVPVRPNFVSLTDDSDPFDIFFEENGSSWVTNLVCDIIDQAIGVYAALQQGTGLVSLSSMEAVDIEGAIERALRLYFHDEPTNEREVQHAVEVILRAIGVDYIREQEGAPVGRRTFKPDFVVPAEDLAIEVKLTGPKHGESDTTEEIAADVAGYRTKWKRLLVIVYDCGVVRDPIHMRAECMKHFGVRMVIIKH